MAKTPEFLFALVGAGDLAVEKVKGISQIDRESSRKLYKDLVKRGRTLSNKVKNSAATKQALEQTKAARSQVKAAATSVAKTVRTSAQERPSKAADEAKAARSQVKAAATSVGKAARANAKATALPPPR